MKFFLNQIKRDAFDSPFAFEEQVDLSEIKEKNMDIKQVNQATVKGEVFLQKEEITFSFTVTGEVIFPCARTLVDVPYSFEVHAVEVFSESANYGDEEEESEIHQVVGEYIDLMPLIQENVLLAMPFRVFSEDEDAINSSVLKGNGWEFSLEDDYLEEKDKAIDPRLKKLQTLLDDKEED